METNERFRRLNLIRVVDFLFRQLNERERNVLLKRYGLKTTKKHTLEQIGKSYNITRERVRQIEKNSITKLKNLDSITQKKARFDDANALILGIIVQNGGVIHENHLVDRIQKIHNKVNQELLRRIILFILHNLVQGVEHIKENDKCHPSWKLNHIDENLIEGVVSTVVDILEDNKEPLVEKELINKFEDSMFFLANEEKIMELCDLNKDGKLTLQEIFISYLHIIKKVKKNIFEKWGLISWKNVHPKRINDKAYLILKKANKPLHFSEISNLINKAGFDTKIACPATVHNELILNDQYVLVGRGIYALKEWGYKEGTVIDIIYNILEKVGKPMEKESIVEEVLKTKMVKKSTIYLSLLNKNKFQKIGVNEYTIKK